jgi:hypothetical protein
MDYTKLKVLDCQELSAVPAQNLTRRITNALELSAWVDRLVMMSLPLQDYTWGSTAVCSLIKLVDGLNRVVLWLNCRLLEWLDVFRVAEHEVLNTSVCLDNILV